MRIYTGNMDIVICYCTKCKTELGRFKNSWNGIGNTYHSPVYAPVALVGIEATGDVYNGATNSQIEHRHVSHKYILEAC